MSVKRILLAAVLVSAVTPLPAAAQSPDVEFGCPGELRGVLMVYVDARMGEVLRDRIVERISGKLPELVFVATPEEAEVRLQLSFEGEPGSRYARSTGVAIKRGDNGGGRLLVRVVNVRRVSRGDQADSFAARFVKDYREANAEAGRPDCHGSGS